MDGKGKNIKIPAMRPPNILDVLRAQQGFAMQAAQHEAKLTELHCMLAVLLDKGVITVKEINDKWKELEADARRREEEGKQVPPGGEGDKQDSKA
jgi:hypothetical protein